MGLIKNAVSTLLARPKAVPDGRQPGSAYDHSFTGLNGAPLALRAFEGRVIVIVNTASKCGFTPQYKALQALYEQHEADGLTVIGVPSNDFANQEPGTADEIGAFCERRFGVTFPLTGKTQVTGAEAHPFFQWADRTLGGGGLPTWNFQKYLIGRDGRLIGTYPPMTAPDARGVVTAIREALAQDAPTTPAQQGGQGTQGA